MGGLGGRVRKGEGQGVWGEKMGLYRTRTQCEDRVRAHIHTNTHTHTHTDRPSHRQKGGG